MTGVSLDNPRIIGYHPGRLKTQWTKNCVPIGLSSAFVEPLEATSISTSIQQARLLCTFLATFTRGNTASQRRYNFIMDSVLENLVSMISLHYISDRTDTEFWIDSTNTKKPALLHELLSLWKERSPHVSDFNTNGYELFQVAHFWHVAQGQGLLSKEISFKSLDNYAAFNYAQSKMKEIRSNFLGQKVIQHHEIF